MFLFHCSTCSSPDCSCFSSFCYLVRCNSFSFAKIKVLLLPVLWPPWAWWWPKSGRPSLVSCNTGTIVIIGINYEFLVEQDHIYKISICLIFSPVFEARVPRQQQALSHKIGLERWHISGPQLLREPERIFEREPAKPRFHFYRNSLPTSLQIFFWWCFPYFSMFTIRHSMSWKKKKESTLDPTIFPHLDSFALLSVGRF